MPFETTTVDGILRITLRGHVTNVDLAGIYESARRIEAESEVVPHRLTDLTAVEGMSLDFGDMEAFASKRRVAQLRNCVRSAIVAPKPLQYGFARMFQTLNDNPRIEIVLFRDAESALRWLEKGTSPESDDGSRVQPEARSGLI